MTLSLTDRQYETLVIALNLAEEYEDTVIDCHQPRGPFGVPTKKDEWDYVIKKANANIQRFKQMKKKLAVLRGKPCT